MNFGNPPALLWGLLIIPVLILYRRRIRLRREVTATNFLWERVFAKEPLRMAWQKYRHIFSLLVQTVAMALLVIALAEPLLPGPQRIVVVVDNSASMNADDVGPSRLLLAKETALKMVDGLRDCDRMAVLSAGDAVGVPCTFTSDKPMLRRAIESIRPTRPPKGTTQVDAAVRLAGRMLAEKPGAPDAEGLSAEAIFHGQRRPGWKIVLISDGGFDGAKEMAAVDGVEVVRVGKPTGNVAIARLHARRNIANPHKCRVLIEVRSFADGPVECPLVVSSGEKTIHTETIQFSGNGRWQGLFEMVCGEGGLTAGLDIDDKYPFDNKAAVDILPPGLHEVLVVTPGDRYLKSVLEANRLVTAHFTEEPLPAVPPGLLMVYHGKAPNPLPGAPTLVVDPAGSTDLWELGEPLEDTSVAWQDDTSPVMNDVRLAGVQLPGAKQIRLTEKAEKTGKVTILAKNTDGDPLIVAIDRPAGRVVILSGDLQTGSLPLRTVFPILITNCLDWVAGIDRGAEASASPADRPGFAEGDIRVPADLGIDVSEVVMPGQPPDGIGPATAMLYRLPPWLYLVIAAAVILTLEYCLYQRRWMT